MRGLSRFSSMGFPTLLAGSRGLRRGADEEGAAVTLPQCTSSRSRTFTWLKGACRFRLVRPFRANAEPTPQVVAVGRG